MNSIKRTAAALLLAAALIAASALSVCAESSSIDGSCTFDGRKISSDISSEAVAKAVSELQPGDEVTFTVEYTNEDSESTDWYMENTVVKTLEETEQARKTVEGTGDAADGGYTYELTQIAGSGKKKVLFSNDKVGGESRTGGMQGLEQATNALENWFYIDTLKSGESGTVELHIAFDGETQANDYMDTDGELNLRFAVEKQKEGNPPPPPDRVKTGDESRLIMWTAIALAGGLLLMILAFLSRRSDRKAEGRRR